MGNFANAACYLNRYLWEAAEKLIFQKKYLKFVAMILNSLHLISSLYAGVCTYLHLVQLLQGATAINT